MDITQFDVPLQSTGIVQRFGLSLREHPYITCGLRRISRLTARTNAFDCRSSLARPFSHVEAMPYLVQWANHVLQHV